MNCKLLHMVVSFFIVDDFSFEEVEDKKVKFFPKQFVADCDADIHQSDHFEDDVDNPDEHLAVFVFGLEEDFKELQQVLQEIVKVHRVLEHSHKGREQLQEHFLEVFGSLKSFKQKSEVLLGKLKEVVEKKEIQRLQLGHQLVCP